LFVRCFDLMTGERDDFDGWMDDGCMHDTIFGQSFVGVFFFFFPSLSFFRACFAFGRTGDMVGTLRRSRFFGIRSSAEVSVFYREGMVGGKSGSCSPMTHGWRDGQPNLVKQSFFELKHFYSFLRSFKLNFVEVLPQWPAWRRSFILPVVFVKARILS
jgi:hypothetical protein